MRWSMCVFIQETCLKPMYHIVRCTALMPSQGPAASETPHTRVGGLSNCLPGRKNLCKCFFDPYIICFLLRTFNSASPMWCTRKFLLQKADVAKITACFEAPTFNWGLLLELRLCSSWAGKMGQWLEPLRGPGLVLQHSHSSKPVTLPKAAAPASGLCPSLYTHGVPKFIQAHRHVYVKIMNKYIFLKILCFPQNIPETLPLVALKYCLVLLGTENKWVVNKLVSFESYSNGDHRFSVRNSSVK